MKKFLSSSTLALLFIATLCMPPSAMSIPFVLQTPSTGVQDWSGPLADSFTVGSQSLAVNSIGVFDSNQDGLNLSITFQLWTGGAGNIGGRSLLTEYTFNTSTTYTLINQHRYYYLTSPVILTAGESYTVLSYGYGAGELNYNENFGGPDVIYSSIGLTAGVGGYASSPSNPDTFIWYPTPPWSAGENFGVASFEYSSVPEPATMILFGTGLIFIAGFGRKRFLRR